MNLTHRISACVFAIALILLSASAAYANIGAAIQAEPVQLTHAVAAGHTYRLSDAYAKNPGSQAARFQIRIQKLSPGSGRDVLASWIHPGREDLVLGPRKAVYVPLTLKVPAGAQSGGYLSDVVAVAGPLGQIHGTALGAAAATKLAFDVGGPGFAIPGWVTRTLLALGVVALLAMGIKRSPIRVRLEHAQRG